ncbi:MAG TPA: hypothetical protein VIV14_10820 [Gammaproteobacteria bacterium]
MAVDPPGYSASGGERHFDADGRIPLTVCPVTAFIGRTQRGPLNDPVSVGSFEEYRRVFGGHSPFSFLSYAVQHFFQHGGRFAVVVRVANRAIRARLELPAGEYPLRLEAHDPGSYSYLRASVDYDGLDEETNRFNLVVQRVARPGSQLVEDQEIFHALSVSQGDKRFVADVLTSSGLVKPAGPFPRQRPEATRAEHPGHPIPYIETSSTGSDGEELTDYDVIGSIDEGTGLFALDAVERVDLLCIPPEPVDRDFGITSFIAAERYCEQRKAILVWDPPASWSSPDSALIGIRNSGFESQNALTYYPRIWFSERNGRVRDRVPACGAIAGLLSQHDQSGVWRDLSRSDMQLKAGLSLTDSVDAHAIPLLLRSGVNCFRRNARGFAEFVGGTSLARSRSVSTLWQRLDRRRLAFFILSSVERHVASFVAGASEGVTWSDVVQQVGLFLDNLHRQGALAGAQPSQAFSVRAVAEPESGSRNALLQIGFALASPGELQFFEIFEGADGISSRRTRSVEIARQTG